MCVYIYVFFLGKLYESISLVKDNNNLIDFFLVGDLNSDYLNENSNLRNLTQFYNLSQIISEPTRIPSNTLLDPILTNAPHLKDKYPNFEVGLKCIIMVF